MRGHARYEDAAARTSDRVPLTPQRWRAELAEVLPDDAIVFSDIGGHMLFNIHHLCIGGRQRFVINLGFGSMGHGTIAPIGAALAMPGRPVFALVGDGCFTMNGMDLLTAAEYDVPVIWIVENNNMHGITWHCSKLLAAARPERAARTGGPGDRGDGARDGPARPRRGAPGPDAGRGARGAAPRGPGSSRCASTARCAPPLGERAKSLAGFIKK